VLAKPFEPQQVIGRVRELLAKPREAGGHGSIPLAAVATIPLAPADLPLQAAQASASNDADAYFDRLDEAFASLTVGTPSADAKSASRDPLDWFATVAPPAAADAIELEPATVASPEPPAASAPAVEPAVVVDAPSLDTLPAPEPAAGSNGSKSSPSLPPLADAFAALLAAEQTSPGAAAPASWPGAATQEPISDELVERIARRVLDQLSDRVVRETAAELVSALAERLVREEIERIKANIK
jgi:hypothetical protein